jgi:putative aldouronate transport system permease protein
MRFAKKSMEDHVVDIVVWTLNILFCFVCVYPFWYIIVASFNDGNDMMKGGVYFWPRTFTLENYRIFFSQASWLSAIKVSVARTVLGTGATTFFTCLVSYALSRRNLMFGRVYRMMFVVSMYVSGGLIPFYFVLRMLGLINNFSVYILPSLLNIFFVMVGINFFRTIPDSLFEASHLDGATESTIFLRVALPLSPPYMATLALFSAVGQWNSWVDSVYYVNNKALRPMAYWMVQSINRTQATSVSQDMIGATTLTALATQATAVVASVLPILCVYPFLQKYFVQGLMVGSVKE